MAQKYQKGAIKKSRNLPPSGAHFFGWMNWRGFFNFYWKEVMRFLSIPSQAIVAPVVTTLLFFAVFDLAVGGGRNDLSVPFDQFIAPGLVMLAIMQNAFMNSSFSIVIAKVQGSIVDVIMPPLTPLEIALGYALGGVTRGVVVMVSVGLAVLWVVPLELFDYAMIIYFGVSGALMLSLCGLVGGILAEKFDHIAGLNNFVITPLAFLSGTFYSIEQLPSVLQDVSFYNPFFYLIDGFRYGVLGIHDGSLSLGILFVLAINVMLLLASWILLFFGVRLQT